MSAAGTTTRTISSRSVLAALGAVALALVIAFAGPLVAFADHRPLETPAARGTVIALVVITVAVRGARRAWRRRRANAAEPTAASTRPADEADASAAELQLLRERFTAAMTVLRRARLGGPGARGLFATLAALAPGRYLYDLPWYLLIGAPGSGKTTALLNAGLRFPPAAPTGERKLPGVGGTRHCDWWFTDSAVLIDTAGRYTTHESDAYVDARAWQGLLALLKMHRPRRPLNGVIVTVSVAELLDADEPRRAQQAESVRLRLLELHATLGVRLPVYVVVTKADLLAGFTEFFAELGQDERAQVWGTTFPLDESRGAPAPVTPLETELAALERRLNERLLDRLQQERDPGRRALVYGFPQQVGSLRAPLLALVHRAFADSRFAQAGLLRGVYLTSGTQEGEPLDRVVGSMARSLGLAPRVIAPLRPSGRSYFLSRLLDEVVFREAALAGTDRKVERRTTLLRAGALALATAVTLGAVGVWWSSYARNRDYLAAVSERVPEAARLVPSTGAANGADVVALLPALAAVRGLAAAVPGDARADRGGFGLDQGERLGQAAEHAYRRLLHEALLPRIHLAAEARLRASLRDGPDAQYDALKSYLMLATPERFDAGWLRQATLAEWEGGLPRELPAESRRALAAHLDALLEQGPLSSTLAVDAKLVAEARSGLERIPAAQRLYDALRRDPAMAGLPEFTVAAKGGPSATLVFARASGATLNRGVPALYTPGVYRSVFESRLDAAASQTAAEEAWVLGRNGASGSPRSADVLREEVRRLYLRDYAERWELFVGDLRVRRTEGIGDGIQLAAVLSAPDSPLPLLLGEIVTQVTLVPPAEEAPMTLVDKAAAVIAGARKAGELAPRDGTERRAKLERELVDQRFDRLRQFVRGPNGQPAALDQVAPLMAELYQHLVSVDTAMKRKMPPPPPDVVTKVGAEARRMPEPVGTTIAQLAEQATRSQRDGAIRDLNERFAAIAEECTKAIRGRYPFARASASDVLPEDFGRLFGPGGRLDGFVEQDLVKHVDTGARLWTWRRTGELAGATTTEGLRQLQRAQSIRDIFFRAGGNRPALRLDFKPLQMDDSITQFVLDVDGQVVRYAHGPQVPVPVQWPGPRGSGQIRVQLAPAAEGAASGLVFEGPWALFRMLDRMQVENTAQPERVHVTFDVDGRKAVFEVTTASVRNPFRLRDLEQFQCPARL